MSDSSGNGADSAKTPWNPKVREKFETKSKSEYLDPCQEAAAKSIRCLHRNGGDRGMCQDYFQAYRDCKKIWLNKRQEDKRKAAKKGWFD
ncbi:cytochrome c oxidase-assembly factor cox23 [Ophiostoma piceae UAMH 11346]|uniref:Cytochrome c oxidase-assembly factor cox23 n=1 Tax=Ophiostoma piceae (strain UAMH 11346) TaxID=1262450 RepID=S3BS89_OPHP1|nr:cytochrome c oxidase-assembly factor cox23 [Ophiostoma piceae UAMH 11346]